MLPNGNFLCVAAMTDLWLDAMVNLKEKKNHVIIQWKFQMTGVGVGAGLLLCF